MLSCLNEKVVAVTPPGAIVDDASWTTTEIDTLGYDYLTLYFQIGATDIAMAALTVTESDTAGSGHAAISDFTASGTTGDGRLPTATDDNKVFAYYIDLRARKRYIDVTATAGNGTSGTYLAIMAVLSRAKEGKLTSAEQGLGGRIIG